MPGWEVQPASSITKVETQRQKLPVRSKSPGAIGVGPGLRSLGLILADPAFEFGIFGPHRSLLLSLISCLLLKIITSSSFNRFGVFSNQQVLSCLS
ncbi:hypothetical protein PGT21_024866 [Puccinia graminis f. sp. tritici]|uniref:Uncharacterized protein n=1 Tax=Puccinia graminis f. sp. tritici TaxID=56615 RepID=A0A5B0NZ96_PUCGR|nr:hypothetical protein PGT21_024866 [Puccinia graminis f. sp. tritici]